MDFDLENYDFVELRVYDVHGYIKGRLVSRYALPNVIKNGMGLCGVTCFNGIKGQTNLHPALWEDMDYANIRAMPLTETLRPCQKIVQGKHRIASVLCELRFLDGTLETSAPREAALELLGQLHSEFGLKVRSSFEAEFTVRDWETNKPFENYARGRSVAVMQSAQDVLLDMINSVREIGVKIDTLMPEHGIGQYEVTFDVTEGIEAVDMAAEFKTASYVHLKKNGYHADFMTCKEPYNTGGRNAFHYNFSLWDSDGRNVLVDPQNPGQLSEFAQHWLAGLVEHAPGLLAISSPTVNCYRRIGIDFTPTYADWGFENRRAAFRVKMEPGGNVYIENRLPGSACSPHLVMASTLAAGMDGVRRKLTLPPPRDQSKKLPTSLGEALDALEADSILKSALPSKLVDVFIHIKRVYEVQEFESFGDISDEEKLQKEMEYYYDCC